MNAFAEGAGPGAITDDGCAVELYRRLPVGAEPEIVHAAVPPGATILELGAGTGRVTRPLIELGHPVVAVDSSPAMLAHVTGARTVVGEIESLALEEEFDAVLLGSHLVNTPDVALRGAFLDTCRRHVRMTGCVLVERHPPRWFDEATEFERTVDGITYRLRDLSRPSAGIIEAAMEYQVEPDVWTHRFRTERVDDETLAAALAERDLSIDTVLTDDDRWVRAVTSTS